ncbi:MAG: diguanylate cyclase [Tardiphaga sp.]|nr:diguanylate cyclase [Tardiphaga sp.]
MMGRPRRYRAAMRRVTGSTAGLIGSDYTSEQQAWQMLDSLYSAYSHILMTVAIAIVAWYDWSSSENPGSLAGAAIAVVALAIRFLMQQRYRRRAADARVSDWVRAFVGLSLSTAVLWGLSLATLLLVTQGNSRFAVFALICAAVQGASARVYMMALVVILHMAIIVILVTGAAVLSGIAVSICVPLASLYLWYQAGFTMKLVAMRTDGLKAHHEREALLMRVTRYNVDLATLNERLSAFALTDSLTGVSNRRDFDDRLAHHMTMMTTPLALLLIDIDHFKRFNDSYGHLAGDECLKLVAGAIGSAPTRNGDLTARYGGEEFAILLPAADLEAAWLVAERVQLAVATMNTATLPNLHQKLTVSIGVGIALPGSDMQPHQLIAAADSALYQAKRSGRNCVRGDVLHALPLEQIA